MLKVFWQICGKGGRNFGDQLTPLLLDYFGVPFDWVPARQARFFGVGSILDQVPDGFDGIIWSSGFLQPTPSTQNLHRATVAAVRGRHTLQSMLTASPNVTLGDGGLLAHLFRPKSRKRFKLGLIPHYADMANPLVAGLGNQSSEICLIDICGDPLEVIHAAAQCEHILSSSLHGLILADALGIPNRWVEFDSGAALLGGRFKFLDYYSAFALEDPTPARLQPCCELDQMLALCEPPDRPGLPGIQADLLRSLGTVLEACGTADTQVIGADPEQREHAIRLHVDHPPLGGDCSLQPSPLMDVVPSVTATPQKFAAFCGQCAQLVAGLHAKGIAHRNIALRTLGVAGDQPLFLDFRWALFMPPNQIGNLITRDWIDLGDVLVRCCPDTFPWIRGVLKLMKSRASSLCAIDPQLFIQMYRAAAELCEVDANDDKALSVPAQMLRLLAAAEEQNSAAHQQAEQLRRSLWAARLEILSLRLSGQIPPEEPYLLVDEDQIRELLPNAGIALPFPEREGHYWGAPPDDQAAIAELERQRARGASYIVFLEATFWWLQHYEVFRAHLRRHYVCITEDPDLIVFDLRGRQLDAPNSPAPSNHERA